MELNDKYLNELYANTDWKGIDDKHIKQIKVEVEFWYSDYKFTQTIKSKLGEKLDIPFSEKYYDWIDKRIQMNIYD